MNYSCKKKPRKNKSKTFFTFCLGSLKKRLKLLICFIPFFYLSSILSYASTSLNKRPVIAIGEAKTKKSHLAIFPPIYVGKTLHLEHIKLRQSIFQAMYNNLKTSSLFEVIKKKEMITLSKSIGSLYSSYPPPLKEIPYKKLLEKKIDFLAQGIFSVHPQNQINLKMFFYSTSHNKILFSKSYQISTAWSRKVSHAFSDDVIESLTGKKSFFQTQIIATRWEKKSKYKKEIFLMDWDGKNPIQISNHNSISISPTWSHDAKFIAYSSFLFRKKRKVKSVHLLLHNLLTNEVFLLYTGKGLHSGAAFHPDGKSLFFTSSRKGRADIYSMKFHEALVKKNKLNSKKKYSKRKIVSLKQITKGPYSAMNVEPALSPDGKKIAFSSDRGGSPNIYVMDLNNKKNLKKLVSVGRYNASPVWSPDGSKIAFAGYSEGHFDIFLIKLESGELTRLTSSKKANGKFSNNEEPSFSPDGSHILFTSDRSNYKQLYIIKTNGEDEKRITFDQLNYERPKWSPFIH